MIFLPIIIFVLGLIIGSFLNVVILRMNTGRSVVVGRSKCARCNHTLAWYELLPVISFLGLGGRCKSCKQQISFQYPVVELLTAIVFLFVYIRTVLPNFFSAYSWISFFYICVVASMLIVILIYDYKHKIVPDTVVYPLIILSILSIVWQFCLTPGFPLGSAIVNGVIVASPFFFLWYLSDGRLMGFGDVKLALAIGWLLGLSMAIASFMLAFWIGAIVGIILLAIPGKYSLKSQLPFAPFLILGMAIVYFFNISLSTFFNFL